MSLTDLYSRASRLAVTNSTGILTGVGVTGTVTTAYLAGRASFKAYEAIQVEEGARGAAALRDRPEDYPHDANYMIEQLTLKESVKLVWPLYIPAVGVGGVTIGAIVFANRISSKKATALAAAYGVSERAFTEYKEKVVEKLGEGKEQEVRDEVAQDRVTANPPNNGSVIILGRGDVLFQDPISGRYFKTTMEDVKAAVNATNHAITNYMHASLSFFYDEIGLEPTEHSNEVGWNTEDLLDLGFSTTITNTQEPCIVLDYNPSPKPHYDKLY